MEFRQGFEGICKFDCESHSYGATGESRPVEQT